MPLYRSVYKMRAPDSEKVLLLMRVVTTNNAYRKIGLSKKEFMVYFLNWLRTRILHG